jgi:sporulation protein YlmC with PRC-barrel domain
MDTITTSNHASTTTGNVGAAILPDAGHHSAGPGPEVMDAATLHGDNVVNAGGDSLGKIEAIMLDVTSGRIAYAVLSFGGVFGIGTKLFAIPWSALTLDAANKRFVLHAAKDQLENAPGFDKDHWPAMADQSWAAAVHTYYHVKPYWDDAVSSGTDLRASPTGAMPPKY